MKILIMTDLEGVAGVVSFDEQTGPASRYYDAAKKLLTAEVNAAVDALVESGVDDVLVIDGHGPGAIQFEDVHPAAKLLHGRPLPPWAALARVFEPYDASLMIGQHAMAGTATSNMNHTQNSRAIDYYKLNGHKIGEIAQFALYCGAMGIPMIFLSGEEDACKEAQELLPGIVVTSVKQGLGRGSAISLSAAESHQRIHTGVKLAIEKQSSNPITPLVWHGPYELEIRYFSTSDADTRTAQPGVERIDSQTIRMTSTSIVDLIYR